jgi:hypothetical protein
MGSNDAADKIRIRQKAKEKPDMEDRTLHSLPGYRGEIGVWMWCLEDARRRTLDNLRGASQAELDWQADAAANTIGSLLYHMAAIETSYVFEDVLGGVEFPAYG